MSNVITFIHKKLTPTNNILKAEYKGTINGVTFTSSIFKIQRTSTEFVDNIDFTLSNDNGYRMVTISVMVPVSDNWTHEEYMNCIKDLYRRIKDTVEI